MSALTEIHFTPREISIINLLLKDKSHKQMADLLHLQQSYVESRLKQLRHKLHVETTQGICIYALTHGFELNYELQLVYFHHQLIAE